jgi:hypothetical protein
VIGVVSMVLGDTERRRDRMERVRFAAASGSLLAAFVVVLIATTILAAR